ncbi:MAG: ABC transporter substrate-binding protein [Alteromonadaceae bacterium]|nr:ABC transporter substrate-binding protein [Alteromonadaceae bacterium]MBB18438.1 ABC transporter substrate-binding protein [Rickettsiales bacterium]
MIKRIILVLFLCLLSPIILAKASQQNITLRVGVPAFPPFAYMDEDQQLVGTLVTYFDYLKQDTGINFELVLYPYARVISGIKQGKLDVAMLFKNDLLEGYADYIGPISKSKVIVLPLAGSNLYTYQQLYLLGRIAVIRGARFDRQFDRDTQLSKMKVNDYLQGVKLLELKRVNAIVGSVVGLDYNLRLIGKDFSDFGEPFELIEQESWLHFSKQSQHRNIISKLQAAVKARYQPDLLHDIYTGAYQLDRDMVDPKNNK